jgi:hypothetical protein
VARAVSQSVAVIWADMSEKEASFLGYRETPRRRYTVPRRALVALLPFFRYSDWRDAWILRVVGERYGPVVRMPPGANLGLRFWRVPRVWTFRPRRPTAIRIPIPLLVAGTIAVATALGFFIARSATGPNPTPPLGRLTAAGPVDVAFPEGWRREQADELSPLGLAAGTGAASGQRFIAVGTAATTSPSLLPTAILDSLHRQASAQLVTLRRTTFYRYSDLSVRGETGLLTVYATTSANATVLAICRAPGPDAGFARTCQEVVQSLRLRSGSLSPGLVPAYASTLRTVIARLNAARAGWGSQLSTAPNAAVQASDVTRLAAADAQAAAALAGQSPGPAGSGNAALVQALRLDADAYSALAQAAAGRHVDGYRTATAAVARANDTLTAALAALGSSGYRIS